MAGGYREGGTNQPMRSSDVIPGGVWDPGKEMQLSQGLRSHSAGWSPARGSASQGTASTAGHQCSFLLPVFYKKTALSIKD